MHQERRTPQTEAAEITAGKKRGSRGGNTFSGVEHIMYIPHRNAMIVEFVLTNSTLNYLKRNCHINASQIINEYDNISDVIQYLLRT